MVIPLAEVVPAPVPAPMLAPVPVSASTSRPVTAPQSGTVPAKRQNAPTLMSSTAAVQGKGVAIPPPNKLAKVNFPTAAASARSDIVVAGIANLPSAIGSVSQVAPKPSVMLRGAAAAAGGTGSARMIPQDGGPLLPKKCPNVKPSPPGSFQTGSHLPVNLDA